MKNRYVVFGNGIRVYRRLVRSRGFSRGCGLRLEKGIPARGFSNGCTCHL